MTAASASTHSLRIATAIACLAASIGVLAQVRSGDKIPDALKDVKPSVGACKRDDVLPGKAASASTPDVPADLTCALSVAQVQTLSAKPDAALIDLRIPSDYQSFHIEGSQNLSVANLHSKPYWRAKDVVLIGNGKAERELYSECTRLKRSGYKDVHVLRGGVPMWMATGQPIAGRAPASAQLKRLVPSEFWIESQNADNLVVLDKKQAALQSDLAFAVVLPKTTAEAIKAVLERRRRELKNAPLAALVLATAPGVTDEEVGRLQDALAPIPLLVYADTREAFVRQLSTQKSMWVAQARGPKQLGCGL